MGKQEELIREQLSKVQFANLSNYDEATKTYHIPKVNQIKLKANHSYVIRLKESILSNDVLRVNYNQGKVPELGSYLIDVISILNRVVKVNAVKYDEQRGSTTNTWWSGYLAINDMEIVKEC